MYSTSADEHGREARFAFTIVALIFALAAFAVAVLTYFAALVPSSRTVVDTTVMAVTTSSYDASWLLDLGTWITVGAGVLGLSALLLGAIHGAFGASDKKKAALVRRMLLVDECIHASSEP